MTRLFTFNDKVNTKFVRTSLYKSGDEGAKSHVGVSVEEWPREEPLWKIRSDYKSKLYYKKQPLNVINKISFILLVKYLIHSVGNRDQTVTDLARETYFLKYILCVL